MHNISWIYCLNFLLIKIGFYHTSRLWSFIFIFITFQLVSPISNFMDERDFVVSEAVAAPQHPQVLLTSHQDAAQQPSEDPAEHNDINDMSATIEESPPPPHSLLDEIKSESQQPEVNAIHYSTDEFDPLAGRFDASLSLAAVDDKQTLISVETSQTTAELPFNQSFVSDKVEPETLVNVGFASAEPLFNEDSLITLDNEKSIGTLQNDVADVQPTADIVAEDIMFSKTPEMVLPTTLLANVIAAEDNTFENMEEPEAEYSPSNESGDFTLFLGFNLKCLKI